MMEERFINRELSWLFFNERVLQEALDVNVPLIQRLRFLGIFSNNLDEFFRVRVATVRRIKFLHKKLRDSWGASPENVLTQINELVNKQQAKFEQIFDEICSELKQEGIFILADYELNEQQGKQVREYFHEKLRSTITPVIFRKGTPFPVLRDDSIYLAVKLHNGEANKKKLFSVIKVPIKLFSRFYVIPSGDAKQYIILLDDVIRYCLKDVYAIFEFSHHDAYTFKLTRDAELDIDNDLDEGFLNQMKAYLRQRQKGDPVRFVFDEDMPKDLLFFISDRLKITVEDNTIPGIRYHNFKDFIKFPDLGRKNLIYSKIKPVAVKQLDDSRSVFKVLSRRDLMLYFPYQSFDYVIDFLREAAMDPKVRSIKISLYRVADYSNVINALINAVRNGKKVTVVIELLARFDEKANIYWSGVLEEAGLKVVYGFPGYKVHCKLIVVEREEKNGIKLYANISTGNFNESTAKIYCDHALLTANESICNDALNVFKLIEKRDLSQKFSQLLVAPITLRSGMVSLIDGEINRAKKGELAFICMKMNNLVDEEMINLLYKAGKVGVKVKLIVRGICSLIPAHPGLSENIEVISIIDKFLEHSRIFIFRNGGNSKFYISSADLMTRNLDKRVEVTCPIIDKKIQNDLLKLFEIQWADNTNARLVRLDGANNYRRTAGKKVRSQVNYYSHLKKSANND